MKQDWYLIIYLNCISGCQHKRCTLFVTVDTQNTLRVACVAVASLLTASFSCCQWRLSPLQLYIIATSSLLVNILHTCRCKLQLSIDFVIGKLHVIGVKLFSLGNLYLIWWEKRRKTTKKKYHQQKLRCVLPKIILITCVFINSEKDSKCIKILFKWNVLAVPLTRYFSSFSTFVIARGNGEIRLTSCGYALILWKLESLY